MKAINLKTGKEVEFWVVSREAPQPAWIEREFYTGYMGWIDEKSLRYGLAYIRSTGSRLYIGDVFIYDGKTIDFMSNAKFSKKYEVIAQ
ncbi:hypothetical protein [Lactococcus ileimucosae]|uniref:hypothetical protein n=1 Tax=Lactococcus ileimucosae TaxID=2941329 RepID=UPI0020434739|nr:hypothetical protein [Lactococcus ileimucosae]